MTKLPGSGAGPTRLGWEKVSVVAALGVSVLAWLIALGGLVGTILALPDLGLGRGLSVAALCAAPPSALWMTRKAVAARRIRTAVPLPVLRQRCHGKLESIADSGPRSLRPIAASAYEVAARTGELLADLIAVPSVRVFHGIRANGADLPVISHAISSGRRLVLVESVAWPPGNYETDADGRVHCDGMYIGQSVRPLVAAVRHWRRALPRGHRVSAVVVVHPSAEDDSITLPATLPDGLVWVHATDASSAIRQHVVRGRANVSRNLVAALIEATADPA